VIDNGMVQASTGCEWAQAAVQPQVMNCSSMHSMDHGKRSGRQGHTGTVQ
jgi:hypothetical protein